MARGKATLAASSLSRPAMYNGRGFRMKTIGTQPRGRLRFRRRARYSSYATAFSPRRVSETSPSHTRLRHASAGRSARRRAGPCHRLQTEFRLSRFASSSLKHSWEQQFQHRRSVTQQYAKEPDSDAEGSKYGSADRRAQQYGLELPWMRSAVSRLG